MGKLRRADLDYHGRGISGDPGSQRVFGSQPSAGAALPKPPRRGTLWKQRARDAKSVVRVAAELAVLSARRLELLRALADGPRSVDPGDAAALAGVGLVAVGPDRTGLTPRGREVWMALRGLV